MKIIFNSIIPKIIGCGGITLYPFVFIRYSKESCPSTLIKHELVHVKQIKEDGFFKFLHKGDNNWVKFLTPFLKLTRKEKKNYKQK
jgi:hypothetical protein